MKVTDVKIKKVKGYENLLGFASVTLDDEFVITGIRVLEGKKGKFVTMPQNKGQDGKWYDICFPLNSKLRTAITDAVLDEF